MDCAEHPGAALEPCNVCRAPTCGPCLGYDVDGKPACSSCAVEEERRRRSLGTAMLACVAAAYLATLAIGYLLFRGQPFVGGLAAVVAIAIGRTLQVMIPAPVVTRRRADRAR